MKPVAAIRMAEPQRAAGMEAQSREWKSPDARVRFHTCRVKVADRSRPRQGDSLKRSGMAHSDSHATVREIARTAARPRGASLARCISGSAPVTCWFCLALSDPTLVGGAGHLNNMFA
jgi:hypothetical protein